MVPVREVKVTGRGEPVFVSPKSENDVTPVIVNVLAPLEPPRVDALPTRIQLVLFLLKACT